MDSTTKSNAMKGSPLILVLFIDMVINFLLALNKDELPYKLIYITPERMRSNEV